MEKSDLKKLRKAIKSMKNPWDTLEIRGDHFSCRWTGNSFDWKTPSGNFVRAYHADVLQWLADGKYVTDWTYSYGDEQPDAET